MYSCWILSHDDNEHEEPEVHSHNSKVKPWKLVYEDKESLCTWRWLFLSMAYTSRAPLLWAEWEFLWGITTKSSCVRMARTSTTFSLYLSAYVHFPLRSNCVQYSTLKISPLNYQLVRRLTGLRKSWWTWMFVCRFISDRTGTKIWLQCHVHQ